MMMTVLAGIAAAGAAGTRLTTALNLWGYRPPADEPGPETAPLVSVCIPARDEAANLGDSLASILASDYPNLEVLVYDDQSTDDTPRILREWIERDPRVRRVRTVPLPPGWNGKQHACAQLGFSARGDWLIFTDADVRFEPDAVRRSVGFARRRGLALASTFPRQVTGTLAERLIVPMIFFVLMSYLPTFRMRRSTTPAASAGCGQFLLVDREAYRSSGGHTAFPGAMHDGIELPRLIRRRNGRTDLFDGTGLMKVRMYRGFDETWAGFAKNAYEGLGSPALLVFLTVFHVIAFILPWALLPWGLATGRGGVAGLSAAAIGLAWWQRWRLGRRFGQPAWVALLHPLAILLMTAVQWYSYRLYRSGRTAWKGRTSGASGQAAERVILVDADDRPIGEAEKLEVHVGKGQRHRAFSVLLFDAEGRTLLQRRAAVKYHFAGRWANACCGHPRPGEDTTDAGRRRLVEELGIEVSLVPRTSFTYRATDAVSGLTEHEIDHVLVGRFDGEAQPNPLEADAVRWIEPAALDAELRDRPDAFAPWFASVWAAYQGCKDAASAAEVKGAWSPQAVK
jgi:isopentenyl-diphosphate delta-isomerase type 1